MTFFINWTMSRVQAAERDLLVAYQVIDIPGSTHANYKILSFLILIHSDLFLCSLE